MRIVMLGHKRIPSREGGIEVVVEELATRMVERGHKLYCFNRKGHHVAGVEFDSKHYKNYKGIECKEVFTVNRKGIAAMTASVFGAIRAAFGRYDIVHFHAEGPAFMCWLPKLFGKKVIVTIHGLDHMRAKWGKFARWYIMCGEKNAVRFADEIIVLSDNVKRYFKERYNKETVFIPNGVNRRVSREANKIKSLWGLEKDDYILYLGRIVPEKGIHTLIAAFKMCNTNKKLVIAGGSSDTAEYMQQLKTLTGDDERVIFTGFVQGRVKHELYSNAYLYVLPSALEGMPLSLLEAMSYGNCCLVSDISECTEVIGEKGFSFKQGNALELNDKLRYLIEHPDIVADTRKDVTEYICQKYNWEEVVDQTISVYEKVLGNKG